MSEDAAALAATIGGFGAILLVASECFLECLKDKKMAKLSIGDAELIESARQSVLAVLSCIEDNPKPDLTMADQVAICRHATKALKAIETIQKHQSD